ncbi:AMP-dependent synthetase/ligase [Leptospira sp. GIMC2001]|uniref:AMP-dependent synthetase/ligase n=1 Tax=Leptospira sp. GIMC2001 TaxID=1513297 RepID=UPI00234BD015|nr:long-chain fatty acid--CoA ligase [Leptospira sp. GIMC2001]WCL48516.1 long-chain fatty acid--CoA ligase [Leptospira sp. GIMC2001]
MNNLAEMFYESKIKFGDKPAFATRNKNKEFEFTTYADLLEMAENLAISLIDLGVGAREHLAVFADNRFEWIVTDMAIQLIGAVDVPRGSDVTDGDIQYIIPHADIRVAFVENLAVLEKLQKNKKSIPNLEKIILMEKESKALLGVLNIYDLIEKGKILRSKLLPVVQERIKQCTPDDLFTLIYTSGTTGAPKGVMLTHGNILSQIQNLPFQIDSNERILSILPVWHIFERVFEMIAISSGCCTYYSNIRNLREDLNIVKPTFMASAPRLWESIYHGIIANLEKAPFIRKFLFQIAYATSKKYNSALRFVKGLELEINYRNPILSFFRGIYCSIIVLIAFFPNLILDAIVLSKIRSATGGSLRGSVSGGGALPYHIDEFFNNIGIPVLEGYGLTETCPVISVRSFEKLIIGTVGPIYKDTDIKIIDINNQEQIYPGANGMGRKGEVHVKGPQVMKGYYKNPEATAKVLKDGWFNTGDLGIMTFNNCIKIVGRSKETIVLMGGENVEPTPIENRLLESEYIDQCMLVGQDKKTLSALIVLNEKAFIELGNNLDELKSNPSVNRMLKASIKELISTENGFKSFEKIVDYRILPKPFEVGDELTAKLSIKRHVISEKYQSLIEDIYKS